MDYKFFGVILGLLFLKTTLLIGTEFQVSGPELTQMNFGRVVNNKHYTIYRSSELNNRDIVSLQKYFNSKKQSFPKTIIYMNHYGYKFPFYGAMDEYNQSQEGLFTYHHPFGPTRTYVEGKNPYFPTDDIDTGNHLGSQAKGLFPLLDDGIDGGVDNFVKVLKMVLEPANQPVLFHCFGGRHRTGMIAMALRYLQGGEWVNGPVHLSNKKIPLNPAQYEYTLFNKDMYRQENIEFIEQFKNDPRFLELKEKYSTLLQE